MKELEDAKIIFGLEAQGLIPKIESLLSSGKNWEQIGSEIRWCPIKARESYEFHLSRNEVSSILASAVETLRKYGNRPDANYWDRNEISGLILRAEKVLKSASSKIHPILKEQK